MSFRWLIKAKTYSIHWEKQNLKKKTKVRNVKNYIVIIKKYNNIVKLFEKN